MRRTIGQRILLGYLLGFLAFLVLGALAYFDLGRVTERLAFVEAADDLRDLALEVRRHEKNYLLYRDAAGRQALEADLARLNRMAEDLEPEIRQTGETVLEEFDRALAGYREALGSLTRFLQGRSDLETDNPDVQARAEGVRETGRRMERAAHDISRVERERIAMTLKSSRTILVVGILLTVAAGVLVGRGVAQKIVLPLRRLEETTRRISHGDFSPIPEEPARDEVGSLVHAFNVMIEELRLHQEQLLQSRKLAALGTLTSGVAHELNNPLSNISTSAQILREEQEELSPEDRLRYLRQIEEQTERAKEIVRNLLDFAREREPRHAPRKLGTILEDALALVRNQARLAQVAVEKRCPDTLPAVMADEVQLQQVFVNLFLNAIQAMPEGGTLCVTAIRCPEPNPPTPPLEKGGKGGFDARPQTSGFGRFVEVAVSDTGAGIKPEHLERIFDPFFTTKGVGEGTGLGLSVSYGIIRKHGGEILVESAVGKGTTFTVRLPAINQP
jgi:signal transduction histidine kinase